MIKVNYFLRILFNYFLTAVSANYVFIQPAPGQIHVKADKNVHNFALPSHAVKVKVEWHHMNSMRNANIRRHFFRGNISSRHFSLFILLRLNDLNRQNIVKL